MQPSILKVLYDTYSSFILCLGLALAHYIHTDLLTLVTGTHYLCSHPAHQKRPSKWSQRICSRSPCPRTSFHRGRRGGRLNRAKGACIHTYMHANEHARMHTYCMHFWARTCAPYVLTPVPYVHTPTHTGALSRQVHDYIIYLSFAHAQTQAHAQKCTCRHAHTCTYVHICVAMLLCLSLRVCIVEMMNTDCRLNRGWGGGSLSRLSFFIKVRVNVIHCPVYADCVCTCGEGLICMCDGCWRGLQCVMERHDMYTFSFMYTHLYLCCHGPVTVQMESQRSKLLVFFLNLNIQTYFLCYASPLPPLPHPPPHTHTHLGVVNLFVHMTHSTCSFDSVNGANPNGHVVPASFVYLHPEANGVRVCAVHASWGMRACVCACVWVLVCVVCQYFALHFCACVCLCMHVIIMHMIYICMYRYAYVYTRMYVRRHMHDMMRHTRMCNTSHTLIHHTHTYHK